MCNGSRIIAGLPRRSVRADEPIFAAHFPVIMGGIVMVIDAGEEPLRTGAVSCYVRGRGGDCDEILGP